MASGYGQGSLNNCPNCGPPLPPITPVTTATTVTPFTQFTSVNSNAYAGGVSLNHGKVSKTIIPYSAQIEKKDLGKKLTLGHGGHLENGAGWPVPSPVSLDRLYLSGPDQSSVQVMVGDKVVASGVIIGGELDLGLKGEVPSKTAIKTIISSPSTGPVSGTLVLHF